MAMDLREMASGLMDECEGEARLPSKQDKRVAVHWRLWAVPSPGLTTERPSPLYGPVLFHRGRLERVLGYQLLTAFRLRAWVRSDSRVRWFSSFHSDRLRLGDPGALDAMLQVLLPAVPLRLALPVACDRIEVAVDAGDGALLVEAVELSHTADEFVFDESIDRGMRITELLDDEE